MQTRLGTIVCKFGGNAGIYPRDEAILVKAQKCPYHVTCDLEVNVEHILYAGLSGDHLVQVWWRSSYLPVRKKIFVT